MTDGHDRPSAIILAGGLALGAYQAGALTALLAPDAPPLAAIAGSSIGAINAAIVAGNAPDHRVERLRGFWAAVASEVAPAPFDPFGLASSGPLRIARNWANMTGTLVGGAPGLFRPAPALVTDATTVPSLYDTSETVATLQRFIDFDRLNAGATRCCIAATDVATAETILFDTAAGDAITPAHLLASSGLFPNFAPVRIGGRLLGDGGFSANAPLEPFLAPGGMAEPLPLVFVIDLFAPDAAVPDTLSRAAERAMDLMFAAQTRARLDLLRRWRDSLAKRHGDRADSGTDLLYLSYRPPAEDTGLEKHFDFSRATLADRIQAGLGDAREALRRLAALPDRSEAGLHIHAVRRAPPAAAHADAR